VTDSDLAELAAYVPRVLGGDAAAWQELVARLESHLHASWTDDDSARSCTMSNALTMSDSGSSRTAPLLLRH
jgi:hypothetical protein